MIQCPQSSEREEKLKNKTKLYTNPIKPVNKTKETRIQNNTITRTDYGGGGERENNAEFLEILDRERPTKY